MKKYKIDVLDYSKHKNITADNYLQLCETIYKNSFAEVIDYLGGRPRRQRSGWSSLIGNKEFIITRI